MNRLSHASIESVGCELQLVTLQDAVPAAIGIAIACAATLQRTSAGIQRQRLALRGKAPATVCKVALRKQGVVTDAKLRDATGNRSQCPMNPDFDAARVGLAHKHPLNSWAQGN